MTHILELYKCKICENIVEVARCGAGNLVCCDEIMKLVEEQIAPVEDAHYAHIEKLDEMTYKIHFNHPMTQEHHFEFIEVISYDKKYVKRKHLKIDEMPELSFKCECKEGFYVRLHCNIHGCWVTKSEVK